MTYPSQSVCAPWATAADVCSPCDDYNFPVGLLDDALLVASEVLFHLSGRQYPGMCAETVRPQGVGGCSFARWGRAWYARTGTWPAPWDYPAGTAGCGCGGVSEVQLGGWPLVEVSEVLLNGAVLPAANNWRVDDWTTLVRIADADGNRQVWPCWQRLDLPTTEDDTWEVTFTYGVPPPAMAVRAAASLGCQLALSCSPETVGGAECRLPERVTSITRQGITAVVLDPFTFLDNGRTGIYDVDLFLAAANPGGISRRGTSSSPQSRTRRARRANT